MTLAQGDRVVFGETIVLPERIIRNADVAKIIAMEGHPALITFQFESDGGEISRRIEDLVGFRERHDPRLPLLRHAYAGTVHYSQGMTVDRAYVASIHAMSRETMYVAMTRHRHVAQLFVDTTRLRVSDLTGVPGLVTALLTRPQRKHAERADSKVNASDFVADLDSLLEDGQVAHDLSLSRYQQLKSAAHDRMVARSKVEICEAAKFQRPDAVGAMPNWFYRKAYLPLTDLSFIHNPPGHRPSWPTVQNATLRTALTKLARNLSYRVSLLRKKGRFHQSGRSAHATPMSSTGWKADWRHWAQKVVTADSR